MLKQFFTVFSFMFSFSAAAAILDLGDVTRDTDTKLDWLDVTKSMGLSASQVIAQMGPGGNYEGWRYADAHELDELITNFGYISINANCIYELKNCDSGLEGDNAIVETIIKTLGDTQDTWLRMIGNDVVAADDGAGYTMGILANATGRPEFYPGRWVARIADSQYVSSSGGYLVNDQPDDVLPLWNTYSLYDSRPATGSFLVRTSVVPSPAAAWLLGSALIGLAGIMRKGNHPDF